MAQRLFRYEIEYYNEYLDKNIKDRGIMTAGSYVNAVMRLCRPEGYGSDLISVKVYDLGESIITDEDLEISMK